MKQLIAALRHPRDYRWWALRPWRTHSMVVLVSGSIFAAHGAVYITTDNTRREQALAVLRWAPFEAWGALWVIAGALAMLSARWPPASEKWGYGVLAGMSGMWSAAFGLSAAIDAEGSGVAGAAIWALAAFLFWAISKLDNPHDLVAGETPEDYR